MDSVESEEAGLILCSLDGDPAAAFHAGLVLALGFVVEVRGLVGEEGRDLRLDEEGTGALRLEAQVATGLDFEDVPDMKCFIDICVMDLALVSDAPNLAGAFFFPLSLAVLVLVEEVDESAAGVLNVNGNGFCPPATPVNVTQSSSESV